MPYPQLLERKERYKAYEGMTLYSLTRDLHHVCEDHPVGAAMSRGDISAQWWADWLNALIAIHQVIDTVAPPPLRFAQALKEDLAESAVPPRPTRSAHHLSATLAGNPYLADAAHYVITGAHLMGGAVMRKSIGDRLPTGHLYPYDRNRVVEDWKPYRDRVDLGEEARQVFRSLIHIMDEIMANDHKDHEQNHR
jgi:hypothetical protein